MTEFEGINVKMLAEMDFDRIPNGLREDKFCPMHGRNGDGENLCICDRWWKCPQCGQVTYGFNCAFRDDYSTGGAGVGREVHLL